MRNFLASLKNVLAQRTTCIRVHWSATFEKTVAVSDIESDHANHKTTSLLNISIYIFYVS
jgi:hypothetical protein